MKRILVISLLVIIAIASIAFKLLNNKEIAEAKVYKRDVHEKALVQTAPVDFQQFGVEQAYVGTFQINREVTLSAEGQEKITGWFFQEGDFVKLGQTLVQLDKSLLEAQLIAAEASYTDAKADVQRYTNAVEGNALPKMQLDKANLALAAAESQLAVLKNQISKTKVLAPFSGYITAKLSDVGAVVAPSVPLGTLTDVSVLKLVINVPEEMVHQFQKGQRVQIETRVAELPKMYTGTVNFVGVKGDAAHNFPVSILVNNPQASLKAGMFAYVKKSGSKGQITEALAIPRSALIGSAQQPKVFVAENGKAQLRNIQLGSENETHIQVLAGIREGEQVVTTGLINLFDGKSIKTQN